MAINVITNGWFLIQTRTKIHKRSIIDTFGQLNDVKTTGVKGTKTRTVRHHRSSPSEARQHLLRRPSWKM
jgi:hypothetical protein